MIKAELRNVYKNKRSLITTKEKEKLADLLLINFQKINLPFLTLVHSYMAVEEKNEIDTWIILRYLKFRNPNLRIAVPKINNETGEIETFLYEEGMILAPNKYGIDEPVDGAKVSSIDIELVLTPLLAFDKAGYRVGFGKGFYDRFFQQCNPGVLKIGLSFFEAESAIDDRDQFDIPLNYCVTPQKVYKFK